jgi:hypothetical protein
VAVRVREGVEDDEAGFSAVNNARLFVTLFLEIAKDAA